MGRKPWTARVTVEESPIYLSTTALCSAGMYRHSSGTSAISSWPLSDGSSLGSLRFQIRSDWRGLHLFIPRQVLAFGGMLRMGDGQTIRLTTTQPHFGGQRFWFVCGCGRRSGRLYLPAGETLFRCRLCCDLTYQSAQEHNTKWAKIRPWVEWWAKETSSPATSRRNPRRLPSRSA
jgi:hypothetical protein